MNRYAEKDVDHRCRRCSSKIHGDVRGAFGYDYLCTQCYEKLGGE